MKVLAICPTIHKEKFDKMHDSFDVTVSKNTSLLVIGEKGNLTTLINNAFNKYNNADYYMVLNDDIVFNTPLWDIELAHKGRISHGDDSITNGHKGNFLMIDGDFCRAVGWLQMPKLNRYCGDVIWKFIGQQLDCLDYHPNVSITHHWHGCAEPLVNEMDMAEFAAWLPHSHKDIEKIRRIM